MPLTTQRNSINATQTEALLILASPKPCNPQTEKVQTAAFCSWRRAFPKATILLFGDTGSWRAEMVRSGLEAAGPLDPGEAGGELICGMFQAAARRAGGEMILYLNSDILLDDSGAATVRELGALRGSWLGSARRWCLPPWSGEPPDREEEWQSFFKRAQQVGRWGEACALDLFLIRGLSFASMPPLFHRPSWLG
jgi:hypothetical protein